MYFVKTFTVLVAVAAMASATPSANKRADGIQRRDDCGNTLGDCYSNGCDPSFTYPTSTTGTCTAGDYNGCPCEKCGGGIGWVGGCSDNGCKGVNGVCTAGQYDGCSCD